MKDFEAGAREHKNTAEEHSSAVFFYFLQSGLDDFL